MRSFLLALLGVLIALASTTTTTNAFAPSIQPGVARTTSSSSSTTSTTSLNVFGNKKSAAAKAAQEEVEAKYWQGEWVCKDCGYIYNRVRV